MKVYITIFTISFQYIFARNMTHEEFCALEQFKRNNIAIYYAGIQHYANIQEIFHRSNFDLQLVHEAAMEYYYLVFLIVNTVKTNMDAILCPNLDPYDKNMFIEQSKFYLRRWELRHQFFSTKIYDLLRRNDYFNGYNENLEYIVYYFFDSISDYYEIILLFMNFGY